MAQTVQLKRSALSGKVPGTGSLNLGELALNTYDGKIFFRRSGSTDTVQEVVTTNSIVTGSIRLEGTGSFGSLKVNDTLTVNHGETIISGSALVTSDLTILGAVNARQFNISVISSSVLFQSGSTRFGNTSDDTHDFTGSVQVTGSLYLNGVAVGASSNSGSFTGSFSGDGSGLRGVVSDDIPRDGWDYDSNSSASINDFNDVSDKYFIDFEQSQSTAVGTPVGFKGFLTNVSGSTQILPTLDGIDFVVGNNVVASIGVGGIIAQATAGTISGSSQLTASVLATTGSNTFRGTQTMSGSILPAIDNAYDLGSATYQWRDIYVSSGSLYIDGTKVLGSTNQELQITTDVGQSIKILEAGSDSIILQSADGNIELKSSGGGNLLFDPTTGLIDVRGTLQIQDGNKITSSGGNGIVFGNSIVVSGSIESTGTINGINLTTFSSSIASTLLNQNTATSSYETKGRSIVSGSSQITFSGISSLPTLVSGSSQLTASVLATTGSNSFIGNQSISGTIYLTGSIIPSGSFVYDLGSETNSFRDLFISTGSIRFHNPDGTEQGRITVDAKSGDISLLKTIGLTNEQKATISQGNINPDFLSAISASNLFVQTKIVMPAGGTVNGINLTAFSSSVSNTILNQNSATSSYETKGRGIVSGSSQITFSGISSLPTLVSGSSQITYASISSIPSGIVSGSSQLNNASIENLTVINLTTVNETASVIFSSGSNRFGDFGNDIHDFTGSVKISGSFTLVGSSTATSYNGTINATNGVVSGSSQITYANIASIPGGIVSGSSQVVSILSSLNTYTGSNDTLNSLQTTRIDQLAAGTASVNSFTASNDTTNTAQNTRLTTIESVTGSYETKGRSIVSGSSQITYTGISSIPGGIVSGSSQVTGIGNAQLTNSSTTIGTTAISLGASSTTLAGLTSVTSTAFVGALTGNASTVTTNANLTGDVTSVGNATTIGAAKVTNAMLAGSISNANLANSSITIGTTAISLGGTATTIAGLTSVSSTGFTGALTGNASTATTAAALTTARTINGTSFDGSANITIPSLVSGSAQITMASTTGFGTYINQAVLTTSTPTFAGGTFSGNVTINSNTAGLTLNRTAVTNYNGISLQTAGVSKWFVGMRENLSSNNYIIYSEAGTDVLTLNQSTYAATFAGTITANSSAVRTDATTSYSTTFTSVSSVSVTHSLGTKNVMVMCYDSADEMFWPATIKTTSTSVVDITFTTARTGRVVIIR